MIEIQKIDHVGIRVRDKERSVAFYQSLGFALLADAGFEKGHPVIMEHPSGVVLNLLGPATGEPGPNVLMDVEEKHPGYTHVSFRVPSLETLRAFLAEREIPISGQFSFKGLSAVFIRDPDGSVIEFDEYAGAEPETRAHPDDDFSGYADHH